jgi:probable rRNA maturation factor
MAARHPSPKVTIDIRIEAGDWPPPRRLRAVAERTIEAAAEADLKLPGGSGVSLLFTDDAHMEVLNTSWRGMKKSTNVLSFPAIGLSPKDHGLQPFLGDIALAFETIRQESQDQGLKFEDHLTHLVLHGFLHLLGFDHAKDDEADRMEGLETAILGGLGIKDPHRRSRAD